MIDTPYSIEGIRHINLSNKYIVLDRKLDTPYPMEVDTPYRVIDQNRLFLPLNLDLSNSGLEEFQQPKFEGYGPKTSKSVSEDTSNEADCNYHQGERVVSGNTYTRVNYNYFAKQAHPSDHKNIVPRAVLIKTGLRSLNTARPVYTAHPKTTVYSARSKSRFSKSVQSTVNRPYQIRTALTNKNFSQKVNTAKGKFYTARPKAVNTARPNLAVVNVVRANQERISKKRTKNEAKTTKPDTEWKSMVKTKSRQSPSLKKSTKVNPDKSKVRPEAISEEK
ncbi:hypothetical protein Tco_0000452 [Tanacetum coccineum]